MDVTKLIAAFRNFANAPKSRPTKERRGQYDTCRIYELTCQEMNHSSVNKTVQKLKEPCTEHTRYVRTNKQTNQHPNIACLQCNRFTLQYLTQQTARVTTNNDSLFCGVHTVCFDL